FRPTDPGEGVTRRWFVKELLATYLILLAASYYNLGRLYSTTGRNAEAEAACRRAIEIQERLATAHPEVTDCRHDLAKSHNLLGNLYRAIGRLVEAEESYKKGFRLWQALMTDHPQSQRVPTILGRESQQPG